METGKVVEIIGAVIDVQFPRESIPNIYDALIIDEGNLTLEVQQQIGDGIVRTIAMGTTDGLKRGLNVTNTGAPINVPVGDKTLGRIMNVLGEPIDNAGSIDAETTASTNEYAKGREGSIAIILNEHQYHSNFRIDKEVNIASALAKIIEIKKPQVI